MLGVLVWIFFSEDCTFPEFIRKPSLYFNLILKTHLPGSLKGLQLKFMIKCEIGQFENYDFMFDHQEEVGTNPNFLS